MTFSNCIHIMIHVKAITINVGEAVYREFQSFAKSRGRTTSELIRESMEDYARTKIRNQTTLRDWRPASVGKVLTPWSDRDDLLEEMLPYDD